MGEKEKKLLDQGQNIAMVGLSPKEDKYSNIVARYLEEKGYNVIPVNPNYDEIMGKKVYNSLLEIEAEKSVDIVNIFRPAEEVLDIVREAVKLDIKGIWAQEGIVSQEGKDLAWEHGIDFVMDKCIKKMHQSLY